VKSVLGMKFDIPIFANHRNLLVAGAQWQKLDDFRVNASGVLQRHLVQVKYFEGWLVDA